MKAESLCSLPSHHRPAAVESFITITNPHGVGSLQLHQPPARGTGRVPCHRSPWAECYIHTQQVIEVRQQQTANTVFFNEGQTNFEVLFSCFAENICNLDAWIEGLVSCYLPLTCGIVIFCFRVKRCTLYRMEEDAHLSLQLYGIVQTPYTVTTSWFEAQ